MSRTFYASSALIPVDYPVSPAVATTRPANGSLIQARHSEPGDSVAHAVFSSSAPGQVSHATA